MTGGRWRGDDVVEGAGAKTAFYRVFASNENHSVCNERHWIPAFAGSERGIWIACDPPTQQSSHAGDDDF
jgi:hypothetical protein